MQSIYNKDKNKVIMACAGSGKTSSLVDEALKIKDKKILLTTYTIENVDQIRQYFIQKNGFVPTNVKIASWFTFLLNDGARPYQNKFFDSERIESIFFIDQKNIELKKKLRYINHKKRERYISENNYIYSDKISEFICNCNIASNGLIIKRLEKIYDYIFIDEAQDLNGYDYDFISMLFDSKINMLLVGDPRQNILDTHKSNKNSKNDNVLEWLEKNCPNKFILNESNISKRCNQKICDFVNILFPDLPPIISANTKTTSHDGIFQIHSKDLEKYIIDYNPVFLKHDKRTKTFDHSAINIGLSKGKTYKNILIFPTKKVQKYLKTNNLSDVGDRKNLYVAVTRAEESVAFVIE